MNRYKWLEQLRAEVRQEKFFVFNSVPMPVVVEFERDHASLPEDYRQFVEQFGEARLFRDRHARDRYSVLVTVPPKFYKKKGDIIALEIGGTEWGYVCYHWKDGHWREDGTVYGDSFQKTADSFQQWFERACAKARKYYSKQEWEIVKQPVDPFNDDEKRIVEALSKFEFRQVGTTADGKLLVEVQNNSEMELSWLDVGVRWPRGLGASSIPIAGIKPGITRIVEMKNSYADANAPAREIELLKMPLPDPADRQYSSVLRDYQNKQHLAKGSNAKHQFGDKAAKIPGLGESLTRYGGWKFVHNIQVDDLLRHPVWLWSMTLGLEDEDDGPEAGDETSMRPLLDSTNVDNEMVQPLILLRVKGSDLFSCGLYDTKLKKLMSLRLLGRPGFQTEPMHQKWPLTLVAVPRISGANGVEFLWGEPETDEAIQVT